MMVTFLFVSNNKGDWVRRSWDLRVGVQGEGQKERDGRTTAGASGGPGGLSVKEGELLPQPRGRTGS